MEKIIAFTDGSARNNPGKGGWGSVIIYPKSSGELHVDELGGNEDHTTNNRMEISAFKAVLENMNDFYQTNSDKKLFTIYTDSSYVRNSFTTWIEGWAKGDWKTKTKTDVLNADLWSDIYNLKIKLSKQFEFDIQLVKGHQGIPGNERCDVIATSLADNLEIDLYKGTLSAYPIKDILDIESKGVSAGGSGSKSSKSKSKGKKPLGYVSYFDHKVVKHATWADCESRVKGAKGAKFKKYFSEGELTDTIGEWLKTK